MISLSDMINGLAFLFLLILWFYLWPSLIESVVRQRLFEQRDVLFNLAANRSISFDEDGYREGVRRVNSLIRFTHKATWQRLLAFHIFLKDSVDAKCVPLTTYFREDNQALLSEVALLEKKLSMIMAFGVVARSPVLLVFVVVVMPIALAIKVTWDAYNNVYPDDFNKLKEFLSSKTKKTKNEFMGYALSA
jgi:hypothetical protein